MKNFLWIIFFMTTTIGSFAFSAQSNAIISALELDKNTTCSHIKTNPSLLGGSSRDIYSCVSNETGKRDYEVEIKMKYERPDHEGYSHLVLDKIIINKIWNITQLGDLYETSQISFLNIIN